MIKASFFSLLFSLMALYGSETKPPFDYDLNLFKIPGQNGRTLLLLHGYGSNFKIATDIKSSFAVQSTLVSFNFPDHDLDQRAYLPNELKFGTPEELMPALYILKQLVMNQKNNAIDLYGFSAGGGALINLIATLNSNTHDKELQQLGIFESEKKQLLKAIENGAILLETPLKSIEEIIQLRGQNEEFTTLANNYRKNHMRPIDALNDLKGLKLNIILYFETPDEILGNLDDARYIERLKSSNKLGTTVVLTGKEGGHLSFHPSLWNFYIHNF